MVSGGTDPIEFLLSLSRSEYLGMKPGLERIRELLRELRNPETGFQSVLIGGTNGKGSTAALLAGLLDRVHLRRGERVRWGLYTSPHLVELEERMIVMGRPAERDRIREIVRTLVAEDRFGCQRDRWTFFEFVTATAFEYFREEEVDCAVVEVGLGGRLDATNVLDPLVSVITNISREHTEWLGNTVREIAREKAGIIRENGIVVTGARGDALLEIRRIAEEKNSKLYVLDEDFHLAGQAEDGFVFTGRTSRYAGFSFYCPVGFQGDNAALALAAWEVLSEKMGVELGSEEIQAGLRGVFIPGRFQMVEGETPIILDGAHNPGAAAVLAGEIRRNFSGRRARVIFTAMRDKEVGEVLKPLLPLASRILLVSLGGERAVTLGELEEIIRNGEGGIPIESLPSVADALRRAHEDIAPDEFIVVTGSLYLVGEVLKELRLPGHIRIGQNP